MTPSYGNGPGAGLHFAYVEVLVISPRRTRRSATMSLIQDVRFALRTIRSRPGASVVIMLTLGLGIGANATFFAAFHGMVLNPMPFADPERLVVLNESRPQLGDIRRLVSSANLRDWLTDNSVLSGAGAYDSRSYNFLSTEEPERISGAAVSSNLLPLLGVHPALGRHFLPEEDVPGGANVVLISHDIWRDRFASDPGVIGQTVRLDDDVREIVGVMPEGFHFEISGQLWTPLQADPASERRGDRRLGVIARLAHGVTVDQAQMSMTTVGEQLATMYPETNKGWNVHVHRLRDAWLPPVTQHVAVAQLILVGGVLLIVCANVTNIVMAQATARRQEKALRAVLGASRLVLVRQALVESTVLALGGGVFGFLLASWGEAWTQNLSAVPIPYWLEFGLNPQVLIYILGITLLTGVLIGLLPAFKGSGRDLFEALKSSARTGDAAGGWLRKSLVVAEYALALIILVAGLLMAKSFANLRHIDQGFETENLLTFRLPLTGSAYDDPQARAAYLEEALRRFDGLAEVSSSGAVSALPISQAGPMTTSLNVESRTYPEGKEPRVTLRLISESYLNTVGIPLLAGRGFTAAEVRDGGEGALVSRSLGELLWPGENSVGHRLRTGRRQDGKWLEVVGVVGDVEPGEMIAGLNTLPPYQLYTSIGGVPGARPYLQGPRIPSVVLKSQGDPANLIAAVRGMLRQLDPSVPIFKVSTMGEVLTQFYFAQHIWSRMFSAIAALALLIAAVGVYGVTAYSVSQRSREMGVRIALGAGPTWLLMLVVRQGTFLAVVGVTLGLIGAVPLALGMQSFLHDMSAVDPMVFTGVAAGLLMMGMLASYVPARRAARVDPIVVLRND